MRCRRLRGRPEHQSALPAVGAWVGQAGSARPHQRSAARLVMQAAPLSVSHVSERIRSGRRTGTGRHQPRLPRESSPARPAAEASLKGRCQRNGRYRRMMGIWPHPRRGADCPEVPSTLPAMRYRRTRCLQWVIVSPTIVTAWAVSSPSAEPLPSTPTSVLVRDVCPLRPARCTSSELSRMVRLHGSSRSTRAI